MKVIVLAGGSSTRLYPIPKGVSKQLLPIYDKPMVPHQCADAGRDKGLLMSSMPYDLPRFKRLLGDGPGHGVHFKYSEQPSPDGASLRTSSLGR